MPYFTWSWLTGRLDPGYWDKRVWDCDRWAGGWRWKGAFGDQVILYTWRKPYYLLWTGGNKFSDHYHNREIRADKYNDILIALDEYRHCKRMIQLFDSEKVEMRTPVDQHYVAEDEKKEEHPAPQLYVVTGDKRPPGYNWLSELPEGTTFLTRPYKPAKDHPFLDEYHVIYQFERSTKLMTNLNGIGYFVVDPTLFCSKMELFEVIGKVEDYEPCAE